MDEVSDVPQGVKLSAVAQAVHEALKAYTAFPWAILSTQCKRFSININVMTAEDLLLVAPKIALSVARFTSPGHEKIVLTALTQIARSFS